MIKAKHLEFYPAESKARVYVGYYYCNTCFLASQTLLTIGKTDTEKLIIQISVFETYQERPVPNVGIKQTAWTCPEGQGRLLRGRDI